MIKNPKRYDPASFNSGEQGLDYSVEGPNNLRAVDMKAGTYTGESREKLKDIAKKNGKKIVKQMDRYTKSDPDIIKEIYTEGSEPNPPLKLDELKTIYNFMRFPENLKAEYKKNIIDGVKESPIFQDSDPETQEQFLKNIYFLNDNSAE